MLGRHILEGVVVLHETIHELHMKKLDGVLFKFEFEKAKFKSPFQQLVMLIKGFDPKLCDWIEDYLQGGSVGIRVNDDIEHFLKLQRV
jgi:hypothetical protein